MAANIAPPKDSGVSFGSLFSRRKLPPSAQDDCDGYASARYPGERIRPVPFQGYCSYTMLVGDDRIVQFRPREHSLDVNIVAEACRIYGNIAPKVEFLGMIERYDLHVYAMRKMIGESLSDVRALGSLSEVRQLRRQTIMDFAQLQAMGWGQSRTKEFVSQEKTVGSSLRWRLSIMASDLPSRFRPIVSSLNSQLNVVEDLPWIMTHGDFIPANILICKSTGRLLGLLDWAEAEFLPFGIGMYGLEELLGEDVNGSFEYFSEAKHIRDLFWSELRRLVPEVRDARTWRAVRVAQMIGIFLWHGIAFDDGRLDRVVQEGIDEEEIHKLDRFVFHSSGALGRSSFSRRIQSTWHYVREITTSTAKQIKA